MPTGPNKKQEELLRQLGQDPNQFRDMPRDALSQWIDQRFRPIHQARSSQKNRERAFQARTGLIAQKKLGPGSKVMYRDGHGRKKPRVIERIDHDRGDIYLEGRPTPVTPQSVFPSNTDDGEGVL